MSSDTARQPTRSPLGARYWIALSIASVFGAGLGDVVSHDLHLGHWRGLPPLALCLGLVLRSERTQRLRPEAAYWLAVVIVRAGATDVADLATHDLHLPNLALIVLLTALLCGAASLGRRSADQAVPSGLPDTGGAYWIALFVAGTLGTVLGDDMSGRCGVAAASVWLGMILAVLFWLRQRGINGGKGGYWITVLGARTAGTSIGDLLADSFGLAGSTAMTGMLLVLTASAGRPRALPLEPAKGGAFDIQL